MNIPVYAIKSVLSPLTAEETQQYLDKISTIVGTPLYLASRDTYRQSAFGLVYISSGGSERFFMECCKGMLSKPVYILTRGTGNSLAAAMESLAYLQQNGGSGEILQGSLDEIGGRIRLLLRISTAFSRMQHMRVGAMGAPSDWLIASGYNASAYREKLGIEMVDIPLTRILEEYEAARYEENEWVRAIALKRFDPQEKEKALRLYGALQRICEKDALDAFTLRCFDLIGAIHTTGCVALSIMNAAGITAGCEGDMPTLVTMIILSALTGSAGFMCNPARLFPDTGEAVFSHCTLPLNMPRTFKLDTHYESGTGVAISGELPKGACTVCKFSGDLSRCYIARADLVENLQESDLCRTQIRMKMGDVSYFLNAPIQNHHVLLPGDHTALMEAFAAKIGCRIQR